MNDRRHIKNNLFRSVLGAVLMICVLFSCVIPLAADSNDKHIVDPIGNREGHAAYLYDNTNGLPTSEANAIAETSDGFIWIGSYGGLIRYDGNTFERYPSTTGIASVESLYVDSRDNLWIGTNDNGAAVMDRYGNVRMYSKTDGLSSASVRDFAEDHEGRIYLATTQGVAVADAELNLKPVSDSLIDNEYVRHLETGADGIVYGLTMSGAIFTLLDEKVMAYYSPDQLGVEDVHSIHVDPDNPGYLYLGTKASKVYYGSLSTGFPGKNAIVVAPLEYINSIVSVGNTLWICANNGVCAYRNNKVEPLENIPLHSNIEGVMADYQGNLWFVSSRQGVMKIVPDQFSDVFEKYGLESGVVNSTCKLDDKLFIGMDSGLKVVDDSGIVTSLPLESSVTASGKNLGYKEFLLLMDGVRIRSITRDSSDRIWFSTFNKLGLVRYDHGKVVAFTKEDGIPGTSASESVRVRTVVERNDGSFIAACTGGVAVIKDDKVIKTYGAETGMSNTEILTVAEGMNGDILAGSDGDGIYIISDSGITHLNTDNGLASDIIMRIKKDANHDVYWMVTSNSLAYMTADYQIHLIDKFPYSNNFDLYDNSQGEVWVLSSNGIYVVKADDLLDGGDIEPVYYGNANGLSVIATSNSYSELTAEGDLYVSGSTGVSKVNIEKQFEMVDNIKMTVPYVDADGVKIYPDENGVINLPYNVKKVTVYPHICTYTLMNPKVSYYLEGFDREINTSTRNDLNSVDYTNLKGGYYSFKMVITDSMGNGSNEYAISIVKERKIYEMIWFYLLLFVLFVCGTTVAVYAYINKKTQAFLKKQEEDKMLIREIVEAFAKTIDMKDKYTRGHSTRVALYTKMLAEEMGYNEETVEKFRNIALLHDIGKIGVRGEVLNKNGRLEDDEFSEIKSHTTKGYNVLKDISIMPELSVGAESHHERPDGKGYPQGLKGDDIPMVAQIIAVADTFDAMYSDRPYRKRMNFDKVVSIISEVAGTQLSVEVVDAFLRIVARGGFRAKNDTGGGSTEDIDNIHKRFNKEAAEEAAKASSQTSPEEITSEEKTSDTKPSEGDAKPSEENPSEDKLSDGDNGAS